MSTEILAKATGAANSSVFVVDRHPVTVSIYPEANFGSDVGYLAKLNEDGTYDTAYDNAIALSMSATNPQMIVYGKGTYRLEFAARSSAIGAFIDSGPVG